MTIVFVVTEALAMMEEEGIEFSAYEFREQNIHDTALTGEQYDLIVSNGVFEHVFDLKGVLGAFRPLLRPGGRVAIFADSLWYSSLGGHINREPWELDPTMFVEPLTFTERRLYSFRTPRARLSFESRPFTPKTLSNVAESVGTLGRRGSTYLLSKTRSSNSVLAEHLDVIASMYGDCATMV